MRAYTWACFLELSNTVKKLIIPLFCITLSNSITIAGQMSCYHYYSQGRLSDKIQAELSNNPSGHKLLLVTSVLRSDVASLSQTYSKITERLGDSGKNNPVRLTLETTEAAIAEFQKVHDLLSAEMDSIKSSKPKIDALAERLTNCLSSVGKCANNIPSALIQLKSDMQEARGLMAILESKKNEMKSTFLTLSQAGILNSREIDQLDAHLLKQEALFGQYMQNLNTITNHLKSVDEILVSQQMDIYGIETQATHLESRGIKNIDLLDIFSKNPVSKPKSETVGAEGELPFEVEAKQLKLSKKMEEHIKLLNQNVLTKQTLWSQLYSDMTRYHGQRLNKRDLYEIVRELIRLNIVPDFQGSDGSDIFQLGFTHGYDQEAIKNRKTVNTWLKKSSAANYSLLFFLTGSAKAVDLVNFNKWIKREIDRAAEKTSVEAEIARSSLSWRQKFHLASRDADASRVFSRAKQYEQMSSDFNKFLTYESNIVEILNLSFNSYKFKMFLSPSGKHDQYEILLEN